MRWGRVLLGGVLAEVALIVVVIPGALLGSEPIVTWSAVIGAPITTFLAGVWAARSLDSRFVLHGGLVGVSAALIYLIPIMAGGVTQPAIYWLAHLLKILGGAAGGMYAARRKASAPSPATVSGA